MNVELFRQTREFLVSEEGPCIILLLDGVTREQAQPVLDHLSLLGDDPTAISISTDLKNFGDFVDELYKSSELNQFPDDVRKLDEAVSRYMRQRQQGLVVNWLPAGLYENVRGYVRRADIDPVYSAARTENMAWLVEFLELLPMHCTAYYLHIGENGEPYIMDDRGMTIEPLDPPELRA